MSYHPKNKDSRIKHALQVQKDTEHLLENNKIHPAQSFEVIKKLKINNFKPINTNIVPSYSQKMAQKIGADCGVLIFGSSIKPGGGWLNGASAQEEDISLQSTWGYQAKIGGQDFYQEGKSLSGLGSNKILYANSLWLYDEYLYKLSEEIPVHLISVAAPNLRSPSIASLDKNNFINILACRVATALSVWEEKKVKNIVLGAIGCGVFKWDGVDSAVAMALAINHHQLKYGDNLNIIFAIPDPNLENKFRTIFQKPNNFIKNNKSKKFTIK